MRASETERVREKRIGKEEGCVVQRSSSGRIKKCTPSISTQSLRLREAAFRPTTALSSQEHQHYQKPEGSAHTPHTGIDRERRKRRRYKDKGRKRDRRKEGER